MKLRHDYLRDEAVETSAGRVHLDKNGYVYKTELNCTVEKFFKDIGSQVGFIDAERLPLPGVENPPEPEAVSTEDPNEPTLDEQAREQHYQAVSLIIQELLENNAKVTTEGYIDMEELDKELRKRDMATVTAKERKVITHKYILEDL